MMSRARNRLKQINNIVLEYIRVVRREFRFTKHAYVLTLPKTFYY